MNVVYNHTWISAGGSVGGLVVRDTTAREKIVSLNAHISVAGEANVCGAMKENERRSAGGRR